MIESGTDNRKFSAVLKVPIYGHIVKVIVCHSINDYCKDILNLDLNDCGARLFDYCNSEIKDDEIDFLLLFEYETVNERLVVHECTHLTARIMRNIGCPLVDESEEPYCYLNDFLYEKIRLLTIKAQETKRNTLLGEILDGTARREEISQTTNRTAEVATSVKVRAKS